MIPQSVHNRLQRGRSRLALHPHLCRSGGHAVRRQQRGRWSGLRGTDEPLPVDQLCHRHCRGGRHNYCGVYNFGVPILNATNNYWGTASGPGPNPADEVCNSEPGTTTVTPSATTPFIVKAPIKP